MTNVREFKPKSKATDFECITCPDCDGQEVVLWLTENVMIPACAECDTILDTTGYTLWVQELIND